jgi:L,D-peptidoglycan transpeptidase YkuD (ErfK/YbiS/YcfS/YnhG family)
MDLVVRREQDRYVADWGEGPHVCAVGRGGVGHKEREGDGITPVGRWPVRYAFYRADKIPKLQTACETKEIRKEDGWCDAPDDARYNTPVLLPYPASAEHLWRGDRLYDLVVVLGYNDSPVVPGKGSAIFLHVMAPDGGATEGCVALARDHLVRALAQFAPGDAVVIRA